MVEEDEVVVVLAGVAVTVLVPEGVETVLVGAGVGLDTVTVLFPGPADIVLDGVAARVPVPPPSANLLRSGTEPPEAFPAPVHIRSPS